MNAKRPISRPIVNLQGGVQCKKKIVIVPQCYNHLFIFIFLILFLLIFFKVYLFICLFNERKSMGWWLMPPTR